MVRHLVATIPRTALTPLLIVGEVGYENQEADCSGKYNVSQGFSIA